MRKINQMLIADFDWISSKNGEIKLIEIDGDKWYRQNNVEYNGKYVVAVVYEEEEANG